MPETMTPEYNVQWDETGKREYSAGVDRVVIYRIVKNETTGNVEYTNGEGWNGITAVNDNPTGGDITDVYANNAVYASLVAAEKMGGTIEAYMYPDAFAECDGSKEIVPGLRVHQQPRLPFGLCSRSKIVNDLGEEVDELHFYYGCKASPSGKDHTTTNESPEAATMSWEFSCTSVPVPGYKPSSSLTLRSDNIAKDKYDALLKVLYGTGETKGKMPFPAELINLVKPTEAASHSSTRSLPSGSESSNS